MPTPLVRPAAAPATASKAPLRVIEEPGALAARPPRSHDAVASHLKPHSWELASKGQALTFTATSGGNASGSRDGGGGYPPSHEQARTDHHPCFGQTQAPRDVLAAGTEVMVIEQLARQFLLGRSMPAFDAHERAAYQEMLQQVAWTALEPNACQEAAELLRRRWLVPVNSTEVLRTFRRCLHSILTDPRVVDIIERQMTRHFSHSLGAPHDSVATHTGGVLGGGAPTGLNGTGRGSGSVGTGLSAPMR